MTQSAIQSFPATCARCRAQSPVAVFEYLTHYAESRRTDDALVRRHYCRLCYAAVAATHPHPLTEVQATVDRRPIAGVGEVAAVEFQAILGGERVLVAWADAPRYFRAHYATHRLSRVSWEDAPATPTSYAYAHWQRKDLALRICIGGTYGATVVTETVAAVGGE